MSKLEITFKRKIFTVDFENATELYITQLRDQYEKMFTQVEQESGEPDVFAVSFMTGIRLMHEVNRLAELAKKLEERSTGLAPDDLQPRVDRMLSLINGVFNK